MILSQTSPTLVLEIKPEPDEEPRRETKSLVEQLSELPKNKGKKRIKFMLVMAFVKINHVCSRCT